MKLLNLKEEIKEILEELENMYEISELEEQVNNINKIRDYIINLQQENQSLKKQLEKKYSKIGTLTNEVLYEENTKLINQQKEFIDCMENKIYSIEPKGTGINYNCEYDSEEDYINAMEEQSKLDTFKEILSKYREIIGISDENN